MERARRSRGEVWLGNGVWDKSEKWLKEPEKEIKIVCLDETYMYFKYKLIRMKDHEAQTYSNTKNRFIAVLRSAMKKDVEKKILIQLS